MFYFFMCVRPANGNLESEIRNDLTLRMRTVSFRVGDSFHIKHIILNKRERTLAYLSMQEKIKQPSKAWQYITFFQLILDNFISMCETGGNVI